MDGKGVRAGAVLAMAGGLMFAAGLGAQVPVPKYRSPIEAAPTPQVTIPAPVAATSNGTVVEYPIVRVNDQLIDKSDYERAQQQLVTDAQQANLGAAELAQRQKDLLRDMIDQQLLLSRGKELEINPDAEVIRELDEIRKQNKLDSMEDLEKAVRDSGVSYEDFKANIRNRVITQQVVRDEVGRTLRLTAKEEQAYYDAHKEEFTEPEQVRLSEILVPTADGATDAQLAQAEAKAEEAAGKLKSGAKFEDVAKQYSGGPNADIGGDLGDFKRGVLPKVLEDQTFPLKVGGWTAPIRTKQGYVVLEVTEHAAAGVQPMSAVEDQIQQAIYEQQMQPALRVYLTDLREKAYIDIAPGFVDTGASAKETKPVMAGYAPPSPKKKLAVVKKRLDTKVESAGKAVAAGGKAVASGATAVASGATTVATTPVALVTGKKPKKLRREKIRYGQAPRNSLPAGPDEAGMTGRDIGTDAAAQGDEPAGSSAIAAIDQTTEQPSTVVAEADPLGPAPVERKKTRFSDRAPAVSKAKVTEKKSAKAAVKAADTPIAMTAEEKAAQQAQDAPLGLSGDTASKKKKKKVKGAPKERLQEKAPAPPAAKPEATPIPPKSVRENGEPVVAPAPDPSTLPVVGAPGQ